MLDVAFKKLAFAGAQTTKTLHASFQHIFSATPKNMPKGETVKLHSGQDMPRMGLGTWKAEKGVVKKAVKEALKLGYRALDCACDYGNEAEVRLLRSATR